MPRIITEIKFNVHSDRNKTKYPHTLFEYGELTDGECAKAIKQHIKQAVKLYPTDIQIHRFKEMEPYL